MRPVEVRAMQGPEQNLDTYSTQKLVRIPEVYGALAICSADISEYQFWRIG